MRTIYSMVILLLSGCADREASTPVEQSIRPAKVMTVQRQRSDSIHEFPSRLEALQTVDLSFEVGGPLARFSVREGETVDKGGLIAELDATDFELAVREAEVQLRLAAQDLRRKQEVLKDNGIAKSQVQDARSNYELQQVRLNKAKEQLSNTRIFAPFEAYVSQRFFDEFVNIRPGEPLVRLLNLTQLQVVISVPETLLATISAEQVVAAWAQFPFADERRFELTYRENRGEASAVAQTYEVSFIMQNPGEWNLLPGMTATTRIQLRGQETGHLLIPPSALVPMSDNTLSVWVYDQTNNAVTQRKVVTGKPLNSGVPVLEGLSENEQIVVTGASQLQTGMKIRKL